LLEAVQVLAYGRSFRTHHIHEAVSFGEPFASIAGVVHRGDSIDRQLRLTIQRNTKQTFINGKREPAAQYLAQLVAVWFTADELEVVRGGPEARRNFLDRGIVSLHPPFAQTIKDFEKVLKQKKRLLRQAADDEMRFDELVEAVEPWNRQLINLSSQIHNGRTRYVQLLSEALHHSLFGDSLSIRYVSSLDGKGDLTHYQELIAERLRTRLQAELFAGACLIGPHRDDFNLLFHGRNLRSFGSAGQQRSALITLDLAAISVYYSKATEYPIFLIDDLDAELDGIRIERLLEYLDGRTQTFVTTSKRSYFERFNQRASFYEVRDGRAAAETAFSQMVRSGTV
jgi:DNA replication and repair protein RecF